MRDRRIQRHFLAYRDHGRADDLAFVFDACAPALRSLARHVLPTPQDADDVLQATFLAAMESSGGFDRDQQVRPWLAGILVNQARRHVAREARSVRDEDVRTPAAHEPPEIARMRELESKLDEALGDLRPRDREVLVPLLKKDAAPVAIARDLGVAPGTARVRIHRALARLRRALPPGYAAASAVVPSAPDPVRAKLLEAARAAAPVGAEAPAVAASGAKGLLVAALGLAVVAPIAWGTLRTGQRDAPERERIARRTERAGGFAPDLARVAGAAGSARETDGALLAPGSALAAPEPAGGTSEAAATDDPEPTGLRVVGRIESTNGRRGEATVGIVAAEPDEDGRVEVFRSGQFEIGAGFELISPTALGRVVVVAEGHAPCAAPFEGHDLSVMDVGTVLLDPGASIDGMAYGNEEAAEPVEGRGRGAVHFEHAEARVAPSCHLGSRTLGLVGTRCFVA
ncbi:MAG: sigma-70 family RNA polymerase sigma factor, partial [Planctomycetota bacterium]